jgi:hypothetical protein
VYGQDESKAIMGTPFDLIPNLCKSLEDNCFMTDLYTSEFYKHVEIDGWDKGHFLIIEMPENSPDFADKLKTRMGIVKKNKKFNSGFMNYPGAYIYLIDDGEKKVYVGQATHLESRALNKNRLKKESVVKVILFSNSCGPKNKKFDEAQIQHLEYTILERLKQSSDVTIRNKQSVHPSITTLERRRYIEGWFDKIEPKLISLGIDGFSGAKRPVGKSIKISINRDNKTHYCDCTAEYFLSSGRVLIPKGSMASKNRWQVPRIYQDLKTNYIGAEILKLSGSHGKEGHQCYVFQEERVLLNISEATTMILNQPQAANAWTVVKDETSLQDYLDSGN